jgi:hypothetical protein
MIKFKNDSQALAAGLLLAVTASHKSIADDCNEKSASIAANMPPADVEIVMDVLEIAIDILSSDT